MKRLTIKTEDGYERVSVRTKNQQLIDKLAYYEDLDEQGRLVKLPCKKGDTVYKVNEVREKVEQHKVIHFEVERVDFDDYSYCFLHHFGKTVFFTKAEAEAKLKEYLKELRGGENGSME